MNRPRITTELETNLTGPYAGHKACVHISIGGAHRWISIATARALADKIHDTCDKAEVFNDAMQRRNVH